MLILINFLLMALVAACGVWLVFYINRLRLKHHQDASRGLVGLMGLPNARLKDIAYLLRGGTDINCGNGLPLATAICAGADVKILEFLLDNGAKFKSDHRPLLIAVMYNNCAAFNLLAARGADVYGKLKDGSDLLLCAIGCRQYKIARMLLRDYGFSANCRNDDGVTALMAAAAACRFDRSMLKELFRRGADAKAVDNRGRTYRDYVKKNKYLKIFPDIL